MQFRNTLSCLIQVFHFTGRKWHLSSPSRSQWTQCSQAPSCPAPGARKHTDPHLVISASRALPPSNKLVSPGSQCLWFSVCQYPDSNSSAASFSKAASRIRMQLSNDAQNAQPQNCSSHLSNAPSQQWWEISQCYKVGGCPRAQRELDPWLLPAQLMLTHYIDKLNNLQKKHSVCFTSVHPLSVLTVLHDKKKGD